MALGRHRRCAALARVVAVEQVGDAGGSDGAVSAGVAVEEAVVGLRPRATISATVNPVGTVAS
jgi:hypothetical protein